MFDMKIFVNVARLEIGQLFTQRSRRGHPFTLDIFLISALQTYKSCCNRGIDHIKAVVIGESLVQVPQHFGLPSLRT